MSIPGWYPDPGKAPGRFRFWDGTTWSQTTTANPGDPPPPIPRPAAPPRRRAAWIAAVALVVVLAVVAVVVIRSLGNNGIETADPRPSATTSTFNDTSTSPTPVPEPDSAPSADTPSPADTQPCPLGDPTPQDHPADGRVHGGGMSFPAQSGWQSQPTQRLSWAYDVGSQQKAVEPGWDAMFAVGALSTVDGFEEPEQAAEAVMTCSANRAFYPGFTERSDIDTEAVTVSGHPGFRIRAELHVDSDSTTLPGDVVEVIVVDLDSPESLAMFWGAVPIGDAQLISQLNRVVTKLQAD